MWASSLACVQYTSASSHKGNQSVYGRVLSGYPLGIGHTTTTTRSTLNASRTRRDSTPSPSTVTPQSPRSAVAAPAHASTTDDSPTGGPAGGGSSHIRSTVGRLDVRPEFEFGIRVRSEFALARYRRGTRPSRSGIQQFKLYFKLVTSCSSSAE